MGTVLNHLCQWFLFLQRSNCEAIIINFFGDPLATDHLMDEMAHVLLSVNTDSKLILFEKCVTEEWIHRKLVSKKLHAIGCLFV